VATLQDILTYLQTRRLFKRKHPLTIKGTSSFTRNLLRRRRVPIPYEKGLRGGYLLPYLVTDRGVERVVEIECYAPTPLRPYYLPISPELTLFEVSAIAMYRPTRMYALAKTFRAYGKRGNKLVFDRDKFMTYDLLELDEDCAPLDGAPARPASPYAGYSDYAPKVRAGRHKPGCDRTESWGPCPVPDTPKERRRPHDRKPRRGPKWTARKPTSRSLHGKSPSADGSAKEPHPLRSVTPHRPTRTTRTEAYLRRLAGGDEKRYQDLASEYSDEIDADRAAGRFEPTKHKK
jgi:hypothetical protein